MRRIMTAVLLLAAASCLFADSISFSGGESSVVLRDGRESVVLSDGASVTVDSMSISADSITLSGDGWRYVTCSGNTSVIDESRGISIRTSSIWYDRTEERILISSWYEIDDTKNEEERVSDDLLIMVTYIGANILLLSSVALLAVMA